MSEIKGCNLYDAEKEFDIVHVWTKPSWATGPTPDDRFCDCGSVRYGDRGVVACEHGCQRRKCEVCESIATVARIALLEEVVKAADEMREHCQERIIWSETRKSTREVLAAYDAARKKIGEG